MGAELQAIENERSFFPCAVPLGTNGNDVCGNARCARALTHKVIHTRGEYLLRVFKKNDLGCFPAIRLENFEHYNSRPGR